MFIEAQGSQITPEISTTASSSAGVLVADIHGSIHVLNKEFEPYRSWVAHVGGRVTHMVERKGILVTLGVCMSSTVCPLHRLYMRTGRGCDQVSSPQDLGPRTQGQADGCT